MVNGLLMANEVYPLKVAARPLLQSHRLFALVGGGFVLVAFGLGALRRNRLAGVLRWLYLRLITGAAVLAGIAGHYGGQLVHGKDHLPF